MKKYTKEEQRAIALAHEWDGTRPYPVCRLCHVNLIECAVKGIGRICPVKELVEELRKAQ